MTAVAQPHAVRLGTAYGRLYVSGDGANVVQNLAGAAFNDRRKCFELSLTLESLRSVARVLNISRTQLLSYCSADVKRWVHAARASEEQVIALHRELATGWRLELPWLDHTGDANTPYRAPYEHQRIMATVGAVLDGTGYFCEPGTAKTRPACELVAWKLATGALDHVFVVCPNANVTTPWLQSFTTWTNLVPHLLIDEKVKARAQHIRDGQAAVYVFNFEVLRLLADAIVTLAASGRKVGFIVDEAHLLRNPDTQMAKAAMEVARAAVWRLALTGTPILNGLQDIWSQHYLIDYGITFGANFVQFRREFTREDPYTLRITPQPGALDDVNLRLRRRCLRYLKSECLDLPPKLYEVEQVAMTREQGVAYRQMEAQLLARLSGSQLEQPGGPSDGDEDVLFDEDRSMSSASNQLVLILRLRQITSGFVGTDAATIHRFTPNPKLDLCDRLVRERLTVQQCIVWACYREDVRALAERFADLHPVVIKGGMARADRDAAQSMFQSGERRLAICMQQAAGVGLDLFAASCAFYYSQGHSLEQRLQSEDRCHRAGSERHQSVTYIDLQVPNSIDEIIRASQLERKTVADLATDLRRHIAGAV